MFSCWNVETEKAEKLKHSQTKASWLVGEKRTEADISDSDDTEEVAETSIKN